MASKSASGFLMTKIIATLGPASDDPSTLLRLIEQGVRIFRINFSHGNFQYYDQLLKNIRKAEKASGEHIGILGDLSGPKIRVGKVIQKGVCLIKGQILSFVKQDVVTGNKDFELVFGSTFPQFIDEVKIGERILLNDGNVELVCIDRMEKGTDASLVCKVVVGGLITTAKGINLPESDLSVPSMTEKDYKCTAYAVKNDFDYLALSFVRSGKDVQMLKDELIRLGARPKVEIDTKGDLGFTEKSESLKSYIPIISKIEKPQAIDNINAIINETDAIMVARGDLGVEMDMAEVAVLQKMIVRSCHEHGRPVIVATQMLESMIQSAVPTRAEVSDVANAILDGADAVMLSGETAVGKYPLEAVSMMNRISVKTNNYIKESNIKIGSSIKQEYMNRTAAIADGVKTIVDDLHPKFQVVWTNLGGSAVNLSQHRSVVPILAFTDNQKRLRQLSLLYSIKPLYMKLPKSGSKFIEQIDNLLIENKWASKGDSIVIISPDPIHKQGVTNRIVVHYLGESEND